MKCALVVVAISSSASAGPLHAVDGRFVDDTGGTVILRGVDVAGDSKVPSFRPAMDPAIFDPLPGWGLNAVRLLFTWEAYEPQPGQFDDSYLAYYQSAIEAAWARGLYVVVDFHQDGFSRHLAGGCGDGFPAWAIPASVTQAAPDNGAGCADWSTRVLSDPGVQAAWDAFYSDAYGARTAYLAMIGRVAGALAGEPGVIGYDMVNEPAGDEPTQIAPLYTDAAAAIRAADPSAMLFVSPTTVTSSGEQTQLPAPSFTNFAYAPHFYDPSVVLLQRWTGAQPDQPFAFMTGTAAAWHAPLFVGELGAPASTLDVGPYMDALYAHLDAALASSAQWVYTPDWTPAALDGWNAEDFSIVDDRGALRANFVVRPAARRISGTPTSLEVTGDELVLAWDHDPAAGATEIFAPAGNAHALGDVTCARDGDLVRCTAPTAGAKQVRLARDRAGCGLTGVEPLALLALGRLLKRAKRPRVGISGSR
jgi:endoglycosylceramidase